VLYIGNYKIDKALDLQDGTEKTSWEKHALSGRIILK
jgi:hypothetical protein